MKSFLAAHHEISAFIRGAAHELWGRSKASPALRERALASAVFAGILAFAVGSLDYLVTGGPDWNPGGGQAYAMDVPSPTRPRPTVTQAPVQPSDSPPSRPFAAEVDYSVPTEVLLGGPSDWIEPDYAYGQAALKTRDDAPSSEAFEETEATSAYEPAKLKSDAYETASLW